VPEYYRSEFTARSFFDPPADGETEAGAVRECYWPRDRLNEESDVEFPISSEPDAAAADLNSFAAALNGIPISARVPYR
jgi:hypothetical protein